MIKTIFIICCIAFAAHAQRPLKWVADAVQTAPVTFDCSRGETLTFTPVLKAYGATLTNYTASLQWQTNGMGGLFWSTNALVFAPSMDVGASRYRFWIRAETTNGVMYSAQGTINMLHAPGAIVNALPLPVRVIDFSSILYTNAPWVTVESDPGIPAAIDTAVAQASTNAQASAAAAQSNAIAFALTNWTTKIFNPMNTREYMDGTGSQFVISNYWTMTFSPDFQNVYGNPPPQSSYVFTNDNYAAYFYTLSAMPYNYWVFARTINGFSVECHIGLGVMSWVATSTNQFVLGVVNAPEYGYAVITPAATTSLVSRLASVAYVQAIQEYHQDSYTNLIWKSVYSNGWTWLVAYTNYPAN